MLIQTVVYVPRILIEARFHGAITAILIVTPLGTLLAYLFYKGMSKFPRMGIPEILKQYFPTYIRLPSIIFLGLMWFATGSIVLVAFSHTIIQSLNPNVSLMIILLCFVLIGGWTATFSSLAILSVLEIILIIALPIQVYIFYKALVTKSFYWDEVRAMSEYVLDIPSWNTLAVVTFSFIGPITFSVFNRLFEWDKRLHYFWIIPIAGLIISFNTFFIPIGIHGTQAVNEYLDVWVNTADSLRMKYGLIERVLFLYLFLYIGLTLIFITMTWHVGIELVKSAFTKQPHFLKWVIVGSMGVSTLVYSQLFDEKQLYLFAQKWFHLQSAVQLLLVLVVFTLGWRKKHA
jgi:hypothetical protein